MAGLPDDLRSSARIDVKIPPAAAEMMNRAADELDARATRIGRLTAAIQAMQRRGDIALGPPEEDDKYGDEWVQDTPHDHLRAAQYATPLRIDLPGGGTIWISR